MKKMLSMLSFASLSLISATAFAEEAAAASGKYEWMPLAIALGIGLAAVAGATGQSRAASAALEGISRNPNAADKVFVPMILGLAFIESLVLFTWVLMFLMQGKL